VFPEGTDNDRDEQYNEDGPGGVALNHNFTFDYPYFAVGAGPHQVSEVESRAVADFAIARPNIAAVFAFTLEDNLLEAWKGSPEAEKERIKTGVLPDDAKYFGYMAEQYRGLNAAKNAPPPETAKGSLLRWSYFHYGRWAFGSRGWWIPQLTASQVAASEVTPQVTTDAKSKSAGDSAQKTPADDGKEKGNDKDKDQKSGNDRQQKTPDSRGLEDRSALAWFEQHSVEGFAPWRSVKHPDFPGKLVEVGGFKPFLRINPPAAEFERLADLHLRFIRRFAELMPRVELVEVKHEKLGGGVYRVTAKVANTGYLPTMSSMGKTGRQLQGLQIKLDVPTGAKLFGQPNRLRIDRLAQGEGAERSWVMVLSKETSDVPAAKAQAKITVWSPCVGSDAKTIDLE